MKIDDDNSGELPGDSNTSPQESTQKQDDSVMAFVNDDNRDHTARAEQFGVMGINEQMSEPSEPDESFDDD